MLQKSNYHLEILHMCAYLRVCVGCVSVYQQIKRIMSRAYHLFFQQ